MSVLALSNKGEPTLDTKTLDHLGIVPDGQVSIELVPGGAARIAAAEERQSVEGLFGLLKKEGEKALSIDEINEIVADFSAGRR